jgi:hypothetical protein
VRGIPHDEGAILSHGICRDFAGTLELLHDARVPNRVKADALIAAVKLRADVVVESSTEISIHAALTEEGSAIAMKRSSSSSTHSHALIHGVIYDTLCQKKLRIQSTDHALRRKCGTGREGNARNRAEADSLANLGKLSLVFVRSCSNDQGESDSLGSEG